METVAVSRDWIEQVRDLLYEVAHQPGRLGETAEALGSHLPEILATEPSPTTWVPLSNAGSGAG